jgi:hypothetical protein
MVIPVGTIPALAKISLGIVNKHIRDKMLANKLANK